MQNFLNGKEKINTRKLVTIFNPKSPISEQYRTIRTNIEYSNIERENRIIMVTSSTPGEGKTTTSSNLAVVFSQQGKKVLLIDADFRKPMVHNVFGKQNFFGLTSVIIKNKPLIESVQSTHIKNLYVLTSGPVTPNPSELLSSQSMSDLLAEIRRHFDFVIIDTPPILPVTDAQILANQCDGVILVINFGKTKIEQAQKAKSLLLNVKARILGAVLNNTKGKYKEYYYDHNN
ncbi:CpsD/CapB family tyrosine-protein kinase [Cytobacillus dafuensis]|uniref:non-specific protein-tyrosine kinase n=1 Tax=Cytobacillus dafuensis TaxID=1742359 RepID=A0A5B8ZAM7_CYTDA|nr:CpsD/CapB family tyrosine-protein kinase [Cytobacillus dafuensis]QED50202.1 CpsD/CapB family tyrosine-protein kinase [Cytobacillus dafuensis]